MENNMTLQRLYNIAQTGQTAEPTAVDNIMAQYHPKQEGGFWNGLKNFAGSDVGRMLIGGLGTAAAVGLSGGSGKDALKYGLMGAGSTMNSIDARKRYRDKLMKEQQERADKLAEAEKLRQHQLTMQANTIQANKDAADLEFERRMEAIREGRDYAEQQKANELVKTDAYIDALPITDEQKRNMKIQARGMTAPETMSPISALTDEFLNPNTTEERREEILPLIQGYHSRVNTINSFAPKEKVSFVDLMKSVKHAKDSGASPETLTQMVRGQGYDIDFTGNSIFEQFDKIRNNPKYAHMTDDEIWNALDVQTLSGQLALHQGKRGVDFGYDAALANQKAENDMKIAEFKNGLPTETQRNITAQSQATGIPESTLYKALYDKEQAEIQKALAQIGNIYADTTGKNIANQFIGAEKQAGINNTNARTAKTRAEIPFVGMTPQMQNYGFIQQHPEAANSPVFKGSTTNINIGESKEMQKQYVKDVDEYKNMVSKIPQLNKTVAKLKELAPKATYTYIGQGVDFLGKQLVGKTTEGAEARAEYSAIVNNQILPLLRDTFGAQFTEREGAELRKTLGDLNASPDEKIAILEAFIAQKYADVESKRRKIEEYGYDTSNLPVVPQSVQSVGGSGLESVSTDDLVGML